MKEERKDDLLTISEERDKRSEMLQHAAHAAGANSLLPSAAAALDRSRMMALSGYGPPGLERDQPASQQHHLGGGGAVSMWNPFSMGHHRMELEQRERERILQRSLNPLGSMIDHERFREQELLLRERHNMEARREMFAQMERDHHAAAELDRGRIPPPLRPVDPYRHPAAAVYHPRTASPMLNHNHTSKSSSPSSTGAPPPLIPSSISSQSPAAIKKPRVASPLTTDSKDKMERAAASSDMEAGSR